METQSENAGPTVEAGVQMFNGKAFMPDAKGRLVARDNVKPQHLLEDEQVRKVIGYAQELSDQIGRFFGHTFEDLSALDHLLDQEYGVKRGGRKGNRTYQSFDGLMKVQVQIADHVVFGPELHTAKSLIDECLVEWSEDSRPELRTLVEGAFKVDKAGLVSKNDLYGLFKLEIDDERWQRAMQAIRDAIRVVGSKMYFRFYTRPDVTARWRPITIDLAKAG